RRLLSFQPVAKLGGVMRAISPVLFSAFVALAACAAGGSRPSTGSGAHPIMSGGSCAQYLDATSCRADPSCNWYPNTRPCQVGQPCPAGWCYAPNPPADGGSGVTAGCACVSSSGSSTPDVCVEQIGGPATQSSPAIFCAPACSTADPCGCITGQGPCAPSADVTNLCVCDN